MHQALNENNKWTLREGIARRDRGEDGEIGDDIVEKAGMM